MKNTNNVLVWVINHAPLLYYQIAVHKSFPDFVITSGSGSFIIERELSKGKNNLNFITSTNQFKIFLMENLRKNIILQKALKRSSVSRTTVKLVYRQKGEENILDPIL